MKSLPKFLKWGHVKRKTSRWNWGDRGWSPALLCRNQAGPLHSAKRTDLTASEGATSGAKGGGSMVGAWEVGRHKGGKKEFSAPLPSFSFPFREQGKSLGVQNAETVILLANEVLELCYKRPTTSVDDRLVHILDPPCCRCQGCAENYHWLSTCIQLHSQRDLRSLWSPVKLELRLWRRGLSREGSQWRWGQEEEGGETKDHWSFEMHPGM